MLSPSPCSLLPAPMQPQPEILAYWTGSLGVSVTMELTRFDNLVQQLSNLLINS
jgi:hypothetical protein